MRQPCFMFAADLHLSEHAWTDRPTLCSDAYESLRQIVNTCISLDIPLLLAGDLFDKRRPEPSAVSVFCRQMDRMQMHKLPVYVTQGQHELDRASPWALVHPWPTYVHTRNFQIPPGFEFYGLDWLPAGQLQEELDRIPEDCVALMCHQVWTELMGVGRTEGSFTEVPHVPIVLTGDYHEHHIFGPYYGKTGQTITVYSPGSTCMRKIDEPSDKYVWVFWLEDDPANNVYNHLVPVSMRLATRPMRRVVLNDEAALSQFCTGLVPQILQAGEGPEWAVTPIIRVKYSTSLQDAYRRITDTVGEQAHLFYEPFDDVTEEVVVDYNAAPAGAFDSLLSAVAQMESVEGQTYKDCQRLLLSPDVAAEWDQMYKEHMAAAEETCAAENDRA